MLASHTELAFTGRDFRKVDRDFFNWEQPSVPSITARAADSCSLTILQGFPNIPLRITSALQCIILYCKTKHNKDQHAGALVLVREERYSLMSVEDNNLDNLKMQLEVISLRPTFPSKERLVNVTILFLRKVIKNGSTWYRVTKNVGKLLPSSKITRNNSNARKIKIPSAPKTVMFDSQNNVVVLDSVPVRLRIGDLS